MLRRTAYDDSEADNKIVRLPASWRGCARLKIVRLEGNPLESLPEGLLKASAFLPGSEGGSN